MAWVKQAVREHGLALLILIAPIIWVVWQSDARNALPMVPLPIIAFIVGFTLRPRHVWFVYLGSVVLLWITIGLWGKYSDPGGGETAFSLMLEAFGWMALGVLLPVGFGRLVRTDLIDPGRRLGQPSGHDPRHG